jgi:hypothetical protein
MVPLEPVRLTSELLAHHPFNFPINNNNKQATVGLARGGRQARLFITLSTHKRGHERAAIFLRNNGIIISNDEAATRKSCCWFGRPYDGNFTYDDGRRGRERPTSSSSYLQGPAPPAAAAPLHLPSSHCCGRRRGNNHDIIVARFDGSGLRCGAGAGASAAAVVPDDKVVTRNRDVPSDTVIQHINKASPTCCICLEAALFVVNVVVVIFFFLHLDCRIDGIIVDLDLGDSHAAARQQGRSSTSIVGGAANRIAPPGQLPGGDPAVGGLSEPSGAIVEPRGKGRRRNERRRSSSRSSASGAAPRNSDRKLLLRGRFARHYDAARPRPARGEHLGFGGPLFGGRFVPICCGWFCQWSRSDGSFF